MLLALAAMVAGQFRPEAMRSVDVVPRKSHEFLPAGFRVRCKSVAECGCELVGSGIGGGGRAGELLRCDAQPTLELMNLDGVPIAALAAHAFGSLPQLHSLFLASCGLRAIAPTAFSAQAGLLELDLSGNHLQRLDVGVFAGMHRLQTLQLQDNALAVVPARLFSDLSALQHLYLSNNVLRRISARAFEATPVLRTVWLQGNRLAAVPKDLFAPVMGSLGSLDTSNNPMVYGDCPTGAVRRAVPGGVDKDTLCERVVRMDCVHEGWSAWGNCSLGCGGGSRSRHPIITGLPRNGGRACPRTQQEGCNSLPCPGTMVWLLLPFWAVCAYGMWLCTRRVRAAEGPEYTAVELEETRSFSPVSETMGSPASACPPDAPALLISRRIVAAGTPQRTPPPYAGDDWQPAKRSDDEVAALMIEGQFGGGSRRERQDVGSPSKSRREKLRARSEN